MRKAVEMWNASADTQLQLQGPPRLTRLPVLFEDAAPVFRGIYEDEVGVVFINRRLRDSRVRSIVVAHELGHAFGLWHVAPADGPSVMIDGNVEFPPTSGDASRLRMRWPSCGEVTSP